MPTYGYECTACADHFEVMQSIKDAPLTTCDSCGGTLRKRIYPVGIAFKGSGFYVNDYTRKSEGNKSEGDGAASTEAKPTDSKSPEAAPAKTETKSETKSEAKFEAAPAA